MELVLPSEKYKESYIEAIEEFQKEGRHEDDSISDLQDHFDEFLTKMQDSREGKNLKEGRVPATDYWLIDGEKFIGRVNIRHYLNDNLERIGGHIGYEIRPTERQKGYGSAQLHLALEKAREFGLEKVLLTCDEGNTGSKKIIEKNGGVFDSVVKSEGEPNKLRFWIEL